ncbi:PiggyBac transposable element-derived protein 4, partial [Stegodyphus mimosarum]
MNREDPSPLGLLLSLFSVDFMENMVFQTNLYATQSEKNFNPISLKELATFLAINILMGIKKLPSYRDFWSSDELLHDNYVSKQMPVKSFSWMLSHFHLNDNSLQPHRGDENFDKLYKVQPLLSHLSERFERVFRPGKCQAIDESMIKFKGRSSLKQYMPKKPIKRGYKVWMRCDESGFASQFQIYTGKVKEVERNLGERVVKTLTEELYQKHHRLYMDNFFTSYDLFRFLDTQNIYCSGTVNLNRKNLPKTLTEDKKLKRGQFDWAVSNEVTWKDKRCVAMLSTQDNPTEIVFVERTEKDGKKIKVPCPKVVSDYNKNMGFVDHFDHLKSLYEIDRKSKKWWHRIFFHFLDVAIVNSFIMYKLHPSSESELKVMKNFRLDIARSLMSLGSAGKLKHRVLKSSTPVTVKKPKQFVPEEKRIQNVEHIPKKCKSRRCAYCSTTGKPHRTRWMCETCNVGLCMFQKNVTCFEKFHKK